MNIKEARAKFDSYGHNWDLDYFNNDNGGYLVIDKQRIAQSELSKNERVKFKKEKEMSLVFSNNGYKIELLGENPRIPSPDITIDGVLSDLKKLSSHNNIVKEAKDAIVNKGAKIVVFEFSENNKEIQTQLIKLANSYNIHGYFYFSSNKNKIYKF